jgi:hypothetical protein
MRHNEQKKPKNKKATGNFLTPITTAWAIRGFKHGPGSLEVFISTGQEISPVIKDIITNSNTMCNKIH